MPIFPELLWYADLCERQADRSVASLAWRQKVSADKPHQINSAMQAPCAKGMLAAQLSLCFAAVTGLIKLALQAGKANPAPPVGPALGAKVTCLLPAGTCVRCRPCQCPKGLNTCCCLF